MTDPAGGKMDYNFDELIERRGTNCIKYDFAAERGMPDDVLSFWVADMDFKTVPAVTEKIHEIADHGIFGYTEGKSDYFNAVAGWLKRRFDRDVRPSWLVKTPGVVFSLAAAVRAFTKPGDPVIIQRPVYYPFSEVISDNGRRIVNSPLVNAGGHYEIDFDDFEKKIEDSGARLFLLCSPHNPGGRVWKREELERLGDICLRHGVTVVSDEIHADLVFPGHSHTVFAGIKPEFDDITVTCTSPSKTFNLAGLQISNIFIKNEELRKKYRAEIAASGYSQANVMGLAACEAAYNDGEDWYFAVLDYIRKNLDYTVRFVDEKIPGVSVMEPEGTYLVFLDFTRLGLSDEALEDLIVNKAGLWLDRGTMFGPEGAGFERINIACPRARLAEGLERLAGAVRRL